MHNVLRMSRKAFTVAVVAATCAWSIGLAALVAPLTANAAASGDLVRGSLPAVYYVGADGKRYVFPNEKTYSTWYSDFSGVQVITDAELAAMPIGGNVTYKPGVKMVKIQTDPKVYAVGPNGSLRWVASEAIATELYGANWNQMVHDVPDAFFVNYTIGADVSGLADFNPATVEAAATSINADKNLSGSGSMDVSIRANSAMPSGATLPKGASGVNMLKFDVVNNSGDAVDLNSLTVHRNGSGQTTDFSYVYLYDGNTRLTTGRTVNASTGDASFNGLSVAVPAHGVKTLWIAADFSTSASAGNVHYLSVSELMYGTTSVSGLPVMGPQFTMSGASAGTLTITKQGTAPLSNVMAGGTEQLIAKFQVAAGTGEDVSLERIALFQGGAVSTSNITNLKLKQAGTTVATASGYDSNDRATFTFGTPYLLERGANRTFDVYADISAGARTGTTETIFTYIDSSTDVYGVGQTYGFGANVDIATSGTYDNGTACALGSGDCSNTRIEGSTLTISFNGPTASDVAIAESDVELYNFTLAAAANLEIRNLRMAITAVGADTTADANDLYDTTDSAANVSDIKLVDTATGVTVAGPLSLTAVSGVSANDQTQTLTFTETFSLAAGSSTTLAVTADIRNSSDNASDILRVDLSAFTTNDVRNLDNSTYLSTTTDIVPNSGINGNQFTVRAPSLTTALASTPVAQTYIKGSSGVDLTGVTLTAGTGADVYVNSIALTGYIDTNDASATCTVSQDDTLAQGSENTSCDSIATTVLTAGLWNGDTQVGTTKAPSTSSAAGSGGVLTFNNLGLVIPASETVNLTLRGDLSSGLSSTNLSYKIRFDVAATTDVTSTDESGNSIAATGTTTGTVMTISNAGTLSAALAPDDSDSEAGIVVSNSSNVVLAKYKFTATSEELKVTKARFFVSTSSDDAISSLSLYDGSTLVGGPVAMLSTGVVEFTGVNFVVPKDGNKVLTVKGNLAEVGTGAATPGSDLAVTFDYDTSFEARGTGAGSNTTVTSAGSANVAGRAKIVRKSKPTVSLVALPQSVLTNGTHAIMRFSVAADAAGDISFKKLTFTSNTSSNPALTVQSGTSSIRRVGDGSDLAGRAVASGTACATGTAGACTITVYLTNEEVVSAGTSRTYDLRMTVASVSAVGDSISTTLNGESSVSVVSGYLAGQLDTLTPANVTDIGDVFSVAGIKASGSISFTATVATVANVCTGLAAAINADTDSYVTAIDSTTTVHIYAKSGTDAAQVGYVPVPTATDVGGGTDNQTLTLASLVTPFEIDTASDGDGSTYTAASEDASSYSFVWSDNAFVTHTDTAYYVDTLASSITVPYDWTNGSYVKILTTDTQTMSK